MQLALFDLDNTLLAGDSDYEWGQFLIDKGVLDRSSHEDKNKAFYKAYNEGNLDINTFLSYQLGNLAAHSRQQLDEWLREFIPKKIYPLINPTARELVNSHSKDIRVMVTATNSFITRPIAREFGIDNLIATDPEVVRGEFSGLVQGTPAFREGKVDRLQAWLVENNYDLSNFTASWFYSDSANDLPLLSLVTNPVAVDPDTNLREHASVHGWKIISLRGN